MRSRAVLLAAFVLVVGCGKSPETPTSPDAPGALRFFDSGCACGPIPYPPIPVYIDGQQAGVLPVFGEFKVMVAAGPHVWAIQSPANPTSVTVQAGRTTTIRVVTNVGCPGDCTDDP